MLAITLGDPLSINVETLAQVLAGRDADIPIVLIGSDFHWQDQMHRLEQASLPMTYVNRPQDIVAPGLYFHDIAGEIEPIAAESLSTKERGTLAKKPLEAIAAYSGLPRLAVLTMPIDKYVASEAGFAFPGQTEWFEFLWHGQAVMTLAGPKLKVGLVTNHMPLSAVPKALTTAGIVSKGEKLIETLVSYFGYQSPRLAVVGLNPHAGDHGLFGHEDEDIIKPAVAALRSQGFDVEGPLPADTAFAFAYQGRYDGVLAMYHDQGLGPLKLAHFDEAVNLSGGLKHLRVSPDHGPAVDLFLQKKAQTTSTDAAFAICQQYLRTKT